MGRHFEGFIFDLDGTVYLSDELIPGVKEVIDSLKASKLGIVYLSNKALQRRSTYAKKLTELGIPTPEDQVVNSSFVMASYLAKIAPGAAVYVIGEKPLVDELIDAGLKISEDPEQIDYVVASFDRDFHYDKLQIAYEAIMNGAGFVATNPDRTCPVKGGEVPDAAGMIGAIEGVTGKKVEEIAGKPSELMVEAALDRLQVKPEECLLVGDRLETDIKMGNKSGISTALVLSGVSSREDLEKSSVKPTFVLKDLSQLPEKVNLKTSSQGISKEEI